MKNKTKLHAYMALWMHAICHFTSRDMGHYPFYFQRYGILCSIFLFTFRDMGYLGEITICIFARLLQGIWAIGSPYTKFNITQM